MSAEIPDGGWWTHAEWEAWSNELSNLIPEDDDSKYANPEGAQESIILDCFKAYRKQLDEVTALVETLRADLDKAEPQHFSIGLMRVRVKEIRRALGLVDES